MPGYRSHPCYEGYGKSIKLKHLLLPCLYTDAMFKHQHRALNRISIPILFSQLFVTYIRHLCQCICNIYIIIAAVALMGSHRCFIVNWNVIKVHRTVQNTSTMTIFLHHHIFRSFNILYGEISLVFNISICHKFFTKKVWKTTVTIFEL